jgi:hypothetical protein
MNQATESLFVLLLLIFIVFFAFISIIVLIMNTQDANKILDDVKSGKDISNENITQALQVTGDISSRFGTLPEFSDPTRLEGLCLVEDSGTRKTRIGHLVGYCL